MGSLRPAISPDGLSFFFEAVEGPCDGKQACFRLRATTRGAVGDDFPAPMPAPILGDVGQAGQPFFTFDGRFLYVTSAGTDPIYVHIWRSRRVGSSWGQPEELTELIGMTGEASPVVSGDNLTIYFSGGPDISVWRATRSSENDSFANAAAVPGMRGYNPQWLSQDSCRLYVAGSLGGHCGLFVAVKPK